MDKVDLKMSYLCTDISSNGMKTKYGGLRSFFEVHDFLVEQQPLCAIEILDTSTAQ
jgi:hypothetical protein